MSERDEVVADPAVPRAPIATRAPAPTPRRLSRKALIALTGVSAIGVAAALGYSLSTSHHSQAPQEAVSVDRRNTDALADAPKDYGDLARTSAANIAAPPTTGTEPITPQPQAIASTASNPSNQEALQARQRARQQRDSALESKLFGASGAGGQKAAPVDVGESNASASGQTAAATAGATAPVDAQDRKTAFVVGGSREPTVNSGRLTAPAGRYVVSAGSTIAAALITGLSSDLPGQVVAQVTEDVFDSVTGRTRLIPQGTRLIGTYDARVTYGQSRALVVWTRMIFPDGRSIDLDRMIGTDGAGQSGFADRVNNHTGKLLMAGLLSTMFGVGANAATAGGDNADIAFAIRESAGRSVESAGDKIVSRQLDVQPTITVRPGARVRVIVSRDLLLEP